jgi:hypothetical protein
MAWRGEISEKAARGEQKWSRTYHSHKMFGAHSPLIFEANMLRRK